MKDFTWTKEKEERAAERMRKYWNDKRVTVSRGPAGFVLTKTGHLIEGQQIIEALERLSKKPVGSRREAHIGNWIYVLV